MPKRKERQNQMRIRRRKRALRRKAKLFDRAMKFDKGHMTTADDVKA